MNMKRYTAETMVNAMKKVRADFGDDALILSSNVVKSKGFLGLFKKKSVEIVAGYDQPVQRQDERINKPLFTVSDSKVDLTEEIKKELAEMRQLLKNIHPPMDNSRYPDNMQRLLVHLKEQGVSESLITYIGDDIFSKMKEEKRDISTEEQCELTKEILMEKIGHLPFGGISFKKKYINVLGTTGVGKTTTIAKIAARAIFEEKKKVGFITTDTYRIAAIEQLRTYAKLLQAPIEIVYNNSDFKKAIEKFEDLDLVFIDTTGRNYKDTKYVDEINDLVDFSPDLESYLVLSLTSKEDDMQTIIEQFSSFPIEKFIFTKIDETNSIGPLFNLMQLYSVGTAYYTDGQEVPEDIREATSDELISLLLEGIRYA